MESIVERVLAGMDAMKIEIGEREAQERELLEGMEEHRRAVLTQLSGEESKRRAAVRSAYEEQQQFFAVRPGEGLAHGGFVRGVRINVPHFSDSEGQEALAVSLMICMAQGSRHRPLPGWEAPIS